MPLTVLIVADDSAVAAIARFYLLWDAQAVVGLGVHGEGNFDVVEGEVFADVCWLAGRGGGHQRHAPGRAVAGCGPVVVSHVLACVGRHAAG